MTKIELDQSLNFLFEQNNNLQIIVYAVFRNGTLKTLNIKDTDLPPLKTLFLASIQASILDKENHCVIPLSTADDRRNCFYQFDLELPEDLQQTQSVIGNDNIPNVSHDSDEIIDIDHLIILLGNRMTQVTLFKKIGPLEVLGRGGYIIKKAREMFERYSENLLRISPGFQIIYVNNELIVTDLNFIEKNLGIHDVIMTEAQVGLNSIQAIDIIENFSDFGGLVTNITFARKLTKISRDSPVLLNRIPNEQIINFAMSNPATRGKLKLNEDGTKFNLRSKASKNLFLKLLNDDFLTSELTRLYYDTLAKDGIELNEGE